MSFLQRGYVIPLVSVNDIIDGFKITRESFEYNQIICSLPSHAKIIHGVRHYYLDAITEWFKLRYSAIPEHLVGVRFIQVKDILLMTGARDSKRINFMIKNNGFPECELISKSGNRLFNEKKVIDWMRSKNININRDDRELINKFLAGKKL